MPPARTISLLCLEDTPSRSQRCFAVYHNNVIIYNLLNGSCVGHLKELHPREITAVLFFNPLKVCWCTCKLFVSCERVCTCQLNWFPSPYFLRFVILQAVAQPRISSAFAKSHEIHEGTQNTAKLIRFIRNRTKCMSVQPIWNLSWVFRCLT